MSETNLQVDEMKLPDDFKYPNLIRGWVCFDTETTGFTKFDDILQISFVDFKGLAINEYFNSRPKINKLKSGRTSITRKRTWKKSMAVHHITPEMVQDKLSLIERKDEFRELFQKYPIIIGYNVEFDVRMVASNIWYHIEYYSGIIDVLKLWKEYKAKNAISTPNDKLITASKFFGWDYTEYAHNALADVYATIYVMQKILISDAEIYEECLAVQKTPYQKKKNYATTSKPTAPAKPKVVVTPTNKNVKLDMFAEDDEFDSEHPF